MAVLIALLGAVGFVLLIACANVATCSWRARATGPRRHPPSARRFRWRIVRQLLVESVLLSVAGGLCGLALSYPAVQASESPAEAAPPSWVQFTMDWRVFTYLVVLCAGSAPVCGLVPAWQASRPISWRC